MPSITKETFFLSRNQAKGPAAPDQKHPQSTVIGRFELVPAVLPIEVENRPSPASLIVREQPDKSISEDSKRNVFTGCLKPIVKIRIDAI
jgi:hypothetical protein